MGVKASRSTASSFDWIRVRKFSSYVITIDKDSALRAPSEILELPDFSGVKITPGGTLTLGEGFTSGHYSYMSSKYILPFDVKIFIPSMEIPEGEIGKIKLDVSLDGGKHFTVNTVKDKYYYASQEDFISGDNLKFKIEFSEGATKVPELESISFDYRPGVITLIHPNGGEKFKPGDIETITWSAWEYEETYPLTLEYSINGGKSYLSIMDSVPNTGKFEWKVPNVASDSALIRISDFYSTTKVFDVSDKFFIIDEKAVKDKAEEGKDGKGKAGDGERDAYGNLIGSKKVPTKILYDILIKRTSNYSKDKAEDERACYKEGDIVMLKPNGHIWSETEKASYYILQAYLYESEAKELVSSTKVATGAYERGRPILKTVKREGKRFNLLEELKNKNVK
ncbi:MAG: hypothetical protein ACD_79C01320G0001 [uncultured bacterium]|nr:MAG: hypothetical protein ACD_79C01320G0001 [uncultured bacterium]